MTYARASAHLLQSRDDIDFEAGPDGVSLRPVGDGGPEILQELVAQPAHEEIQLLPRNDEREILVLAFRFHSTT
jgi:hypothetical protein